MNDDLLCDVVVKYLENRYYVHDGDYGLTVAARLERATDKAAERLPSLEAVLKKALVRYDGTPLREQQVQQADTHLVVERRGVAKLVTAIVYLYWRMDFDSVEVAEQLGLKSPHVREILYRLGRAWRQLQPNAPEPKSRLRQEAPAAYPSLALDGVNWAKRAIDTVWNPATRRWDLVYPETTRARQPSPGS